MNQALLLILALSIGSSVAVSLENRLLKIILHYNHPCFFIQEPEECQLCRDNVKKLMDYGIETTTAQQFLLIENVFLIEIYSITLSQCQMVFCRFAITESLRPEVAAWE